MPPRTDHPQDEEPEDASFRRSEFAMTLPFGPVLYFRGARHRTWNLSALVGLAADDAPAPLESGTDRVAPQRLAQRCGRNLWRYDFALPLGDSESAREYRIGSQSWQIRVPAARGALRLAYAACNGSEAGDRWHCGEARNERWRHLAGEHARNPFHLLLQGGDQLYADPIWHEVPALAAWKRTPWWRRRKADFPPATAEAVADFYFERYWGLWSQPQLAPVLATVPSLMMWDDHDIFDGWGSWAAKWQECPTFQGVWRAAREHFALFQLGARPDDLPEAFDDRRGGHFGFAHRIDEVGIVVPDLRSERSRARVLGAAGRRALRRALESMVDCRHVLLVSSMPLVNPYLGPLERLFNLMPGHQTWQDDLVDQWPSLAHWDEWQGLVRELVDVAARTGVRITSVSGEIHLGALGVIEGCGTSIHQLTSSGVAHPPPPERFVRVLEWVSRRTIAPEPDLAVRLLPLPGFGRRFLRARNWLEMEFPAGGDLRAAWHAEPPAPTIRLSIPGPEPSIRPERALAAS